MASQQPSPNPDLSSRPARLSSSWLTVADQSYPAGRRRWILAASMGVVMGIMLTIVLGVGSLRSSSHPNQQSTDIPSGVEGHWLLASIKRGDTHVAVPSRLRATLALLPSGKLEISDTVNSLSGRYIKTGSGFTTSGMATTLALYAGSDSTQQLVIDAIDAIAYGSATGTAAAVDCRAQLVGGRLLVTIAPYELTFTRIN
jgi:hypothetical protein